MINAVVSMGRRNTQLEPSKQIGSAGEVLSDQLISWCCIDRLSWHD
jgi:hypothetical protein